MSEPQGTRSSENNPWKTALIAGGAAALIFIATGAVFAYLQDDDIEEPAEIAAEAAAPRPAAAPTPQVASAPPASIVEDCNRYAAAADRNEMEIAKDGLLGGAIVGAAGGTLYGLNQENQRTEGARYAYQECMARRGY